MLFLQSFPIGQGALRMSRCFLKDKKRKKEKSGAKHSDGNERPSDFVRFKAGLKLAHRNPGLQKQPRKMSSPVSSLSVGTFGLGEQWA